MSEMVADNAVDGVITDVSPHQRFKDSLVRQAEVEAPTRATDVAAAQVTKILTAETIDDIWAADEGGVISGQDMEDVELEIHDYGLAKSADQYNTNLGVYVLIDATRMDTGEKVIINTGSDLIIAKLAKFRQADAFPIEGVIKGTPTSSGGRLLRLRPLPRRAVRGQSAPVE
jgi:hypothetical protein